MPAPAPFAGDFALTETENLIYTLPCVQGRIAQVGERFPYKEEVTGSSPVSPTILLDRTSRRGGVV